MDAARIIKSAILMPDVARMYGFEPTRSGFIICPFHAERTPSMKLYPTRAVCFGGCGWQGDVIDFVSGVLNLPFRAACERISADFHLGIDLSAPVDTDALRRRRAAQDAKKRVQAERDKQVRALCDEHRRLWQAKQTKAPKTPDEEPDAEWVEALMRLDWVAYQIECLEANQ